MMTTSLRSAVTQPRRNNSCRCVGRPPPDQPCRYSAHRGWKTRPPQTKKAGWQSYCPLGTKCRAGASSCSTSISWPSRQTRSFTRSPTARRSRAAAKCSRWPSTSQKPRLSIPWPSNASSTSPARRAGAAAPVALLSPPCSRETRTPDRCSARPRPLRRAGASSAWKPQPRLGSRMAWGAAPGRPAPAAAAEARKRRTVGAGTAWPCSSTPRATIFCMATPTT
mmetsp:Transcript_63931/g.205990  ORF Transcript_63931/g.205990 Transcript_63931/m.205990 type:complete len:223 (-) Transcript_63931:429-1097(-)